MNANLLISICREDGCDEWAVPDNDGVYRYCRKHKNQRDFNRIWDVFKD